MCPRPIRSPLAAALTLLVVGPGCLPASHIVPTYQVRQHLAELRAEGSLEVVDRSGNSLDLELSDVDTESDRTISDLARGCEGRSTTSGPVIGSRCGLADVRTVAIDRPDVWASIGLWAGALLVGAAVGTVVGLMTASSRMTAPSP